LPQITSTFQAFPHPVPSLLRYFVPAQPLSTPLPSYTPPSFTRILPKSLPPAVVYSAVVNPVRPPVISALVPPSCHRLPRCLLCVSATPSFTEHRRLQPPPASSTSPTSPTPLLSRPRFRCFCCDDSRTNTQIERTYSDMRRENGIRTTYQWDELEA